MGIFAALVLALIVSMIFSVTFRNRETSGMPVVITFLVLALSGVAAQYWISPFGPTLLGFTWMPLIGAELIMALLLVALSPFSQQRPASRNEPFEKEDKAPATAAGITLILWILICVLAAVSLIGYLQA